MVQLALAQLRFRKRRLVGTGAAIVIGVAFLTGALVLGDTLSANFDRLFSDVSSGTDVVVRNSTVVDPNSVLDNRGPIPADLVSTVAAVPGVATAEPQIVGYGTLLGSRGEAIGGNGPPRLAGSWIADPALNPYKLAEGRAPTGLDEVVINRGAAKTGHLHIGDRTVVQTPEPVPVTIVGIATFGDADGFGTATWTAFTLDGAKQHVNRRDDIVNTVLVKAARGTSAGALRSRVQAALPPGAAAITGQQLADERIGEINDGFLGMIRTFLTAFAVIALLVGGITISNTFSITLAQRTREVALLRAVGASRRQVKRSVSIEALVVGLLFGATGVLAGIGVAGLLKGLFDAAGFALPAGGLETKPTAIVIALGAGVLVTSVAARGPVRRAARVAPAAALADTDAGEISGSTRRTVAGVATAGIGTGLGIAAALAGAASLAGLAALALLAGAVLAGPVLVGPAARILAGAARLTRRPGCDLAEAGVRRNPRRTVSTATALVVGVTVVSLITVFAASLKSSVDRQVRGGLRADLAVNTAVFGGSQLSPDVLAALQHVQGVHDVVGLANGDVILDGTSSKVTATDLARIDRVLALRVTDGGFPSSSAGDNGIAVSRARASDHHWSIGSRVPITFADGATGSFVVRAVYEDNRLAGPVLIPGTAWAQHNAQPTLRTVLITAEPGRSPTELQSAIKPIATRFGGDVQDPQAMSDANTRGLDTLLGIVYVLLALAIVVALLGIANALSLAVQERRHEIGLLRAVGQTQRQVRQVLRLETMMVALFGTLLGITLGTFLGWSLFSAVSTSPGFTLPVGRVIAITIIGALAGNLAARRPAKRAARMPILDAIAVQ